MPRYSENVLKPWVEQGKLFKRWAQKRLVVPTGLLEGSPWRVYPFQLDFITGFFRCQESGLSIARKNGKSALIASLLLAHLDQDSPFYRPNWRGAVGSVTGDKAKEMRIQVMQIAEASGIDVLEVRSPTPGSIESGSAVVNFMNSESWAGQSIGVDLAVIDEAGMLKERQREFFNSMASSVSARGGKFCCISIQGDGPMFAEMRERGEVDKNRRYTYFQEHAARPDDDPYCVDTFRKANPGLGTKKNPGIKDLSYMYSASRRAQMSPSDWPYFAAHDLNMPLAPDRQMICTPQDWERCVVEGLPEPDGPCYLGVDLGGGNAMSAAWAYWPESGRVQAYGAFPDTPPIGDRASQDNAPYLEMIARGELFTYKGRVTPVGAFLSDVLNRLPVTPVMVGSDAYRKAELYQALESEGIAVNVELRGGQEASRDTRAFQTSVLKGSFKMRKSLLVANQISNTELKSNTRGEFTLQRASKNRRIDAISAGAIAAGMVQQFHRPEAQSGWRITSYAAPYS